MVCRLIDQFDQFVIEHIPLDITKAVFAARRIQFNSWTERAPSMASEQRWHLRLGHPGPEALRHLAHHSRGVRVKGPTTIQCDACGCSKAKRQIRRLPREGPTKPGQRLAVDFLDLELDGEEYWCAMLVTDRYSGYVFDFYLKRRDTDTLISAFEDLIGLLKNQFQIQPQAIECDNEITDNHRLTAFLTRRHYIRCEPSAPHTQAQNGGAERSGGVIKEKACAMRAGAKLPTFLWVEIYRAAVYLHNRTPKYLLHWQSPYEVFHTYLVCRDGIVVRDRKPSQVHLRAYGCKAFAMSAESLAKKNRLQKLNPKAWIGYLVGYQSTNIYRVWNPLTNKVVAVRDVIFNEDEFFTGDIQHMKDDLRHVTEEELTVLLRDFQVPDSADPSLSVPTQDEDEELSGPMALPDNVVDEPTGDAQDAQTEVCTVEPDHLYTTARFEPLLTPEYTPPPAAALTGAAIRELTERQESVACCRSEVSATKCCSGCKESAIGHRCLQQNDSHSEVNTMSSACKESATCRSCRCLQQSDHHSEVSTTIGHGDCKESATSGCCLQQSGRQCSCRRVKSGIPGGSYLSLAPAGQDIRAIRNRQGNWEAAFNAGRQAATIGMMNGKPMTKGHFYKMVNKPRGRPSTYQFIKRLSDGQRTFVPRQDGKIHRRDLPPPPKTHKDLESHLLRLAFLEAEKQHLQSHQDMSTWAETDKKAATGRQLLDCMWVYVYKFDKHGWLVKCKARLVVRGDQQAKSVYESTYASTLAGRSFRTLMAIAARFDLELIQYDAVNAFVNAKLPYDIFTRMPPGYRKRGRILHLLKAMYGLRESPLLWQKELTGTLERLGFSPVPHEPCCFTKNGILIFFYVDDMVVAYRKENQAAVDDLIGQLQEVYNLTGGHELQWFLGIEIIRDRKRRLIWLSQSDYIDKLANLVLTKDANYPKTPMKLRELLPFDSRASRRSINLYQRRIGSILYCAVITRPDVAFAASRLARFNANPSDEHLSAAEHLIRYLLGTKTWALQLGGEDSMETWSDASYADNTIDRKSSQAYVMKLFGGVIGWRANKQDTVTTSTTEAELLSLAQATKEAMFVSRLIKEIGVELDSSRLNIWCDNQQTIRLVNADIAMLQTKLRHVDIHNHWLRQSVSRKTIKVAYTPTGDMLADGLTKALPTEAFRKFRSQVGLVDIKDRIEARKIKVLTEDDFDAAEDALSGGESDLISGKMDDLCIN